jgi:hypothetical protein
MDWDDWDDWDDGQDDFWPPYWTPSWFGTIRADSTDVASCTEDILADEFCCYSELECRDHLPQIAISKASPAARPSDPS